MIYSWFMKLAYKEQCFQPPYATEGSYLIIRYLKIFLNIHTLLHGMVISRIFGRKININLYKI